MILRSSEKGISIIEINISIVVISVIVLFSASLYTILLKTTVTSTDTLSATLLSESMLEEISTRRWDETDLASVVLGPDAGENAADKTGFDDIDDFNGYSEAAPLDAASVNISGTSSRFSRDVSVSYVDESLTVTASTSTRKRITVRVFKKGKQLMKMHSLISKI